MNFREYKRKFSEGAGKSGYSQQKITKCLQYAATLYRFRVPVIYNINHLAYLCRYRAAYINKALANTPYYYRTFQINKSNGSKRTIQEPLPGLKEIQLWVLKNILEKIPISRFAKAYRKNIQLRENVRFHTNQPLVLTLDIRDFFGTITRKQVEVVFRSVGYSSSIAKALSKLCSLHDRLPQGAPTSPYLSNVVFRELDQEISSYCCKHNIRYTRYADDMAFSGDFEPFDVIRQVESGIQQAGFRLHTQKTKIMKPHQRQVVTGVVVNRKSQVSNEYRKQIRQSMYYIRKYGLESHAKMVGMKTPDLLAKLKGKIQFALQLQPHHTEFLAYNEEIYQHLVIGKSIEHHQSDHSSIKTLSIVPSS
jgi:RNA-directed DNA polymerase